MSESLPDNWALGTLGDAVDIVRGISFPSGDKRFEPGAGLVACLRTTNVQRDVEWADLWYVPEIHIRRSEQEVRLGDILISTANSLELVGKVAPVRYLPHRATLGAFISLLRPSNLLNPEFVYYQITKAEYQSAIRSTASTTTNISNVSTEKLRSLSFRFAPVEGQARIVSEIEKQFTRLDAAAVALKRVQANLKRYRAAVLKAAFEGRLVPAEAELARMEGRSYETGEQLLARILKERRAKWEASQLTKMQVVGQPPKDAVWKQRYKEPEPPDTSNVLALPEGWTWASPDQLATFEDNAICAGPFGTIFKAKDFRPNGVPIIFLRHVAAGRYLTRKPGFMDREVWERLFRPYSVFGGELLITKLGEPPGICAVYPERVGPAMVTPDVIKMSVNETAALPKFLMHYFNSDKARRFSIAACFGTTRLRLTLPIFRRMPVALPPLAEQARILTEVERQLSDAEALATSIGSQLARADRLRQSILKRAFEGKLVPQDPNDEPGSVLLERIRAERPTNAQPSKRTPKTRRTRSAVAEVL